MDDVDTVFIQVKMPSGILCHIELGRDARYGYDQSIEIFGKLGKAISGGQKITAWEYWDKVVISPKKVIGFLAPFKFQCWSTLFQDGQSTDAIHPSFKQRYHDAYVAEIEHFHALIHGLDNNPKVAPSDCLRVSVLAEACEHSWRTGTVVNVEEYTKTMLKQENVSEAAFKNALSSQH